MQWPSSSSLRVEPMGELTSRRRRAVRAGAHAGACRATGRRPSPLPVAPGIRVLALRTPRSRRRPTPTSTWSDPTPARSSWSIPGQPVPGSAGDPRRALGEARGRRGRPLPITMAITSAARRRSPTALASRSRRTRRPRVGSPASVAVTRELARRRGLSQRRHCVLHAGPRRGPPLLRASATRRSPATWSQASARSSSIRARATWPSTSRRSSVCSRGRDDPVARAWPGDRRRARASCASTSHTARCARIAVVAALAARTDASLDASSSPDVYADTPRMLWPLAERSLRAHLDKLVQERRAREPVAGRWTSRGRSL